MASATKMSLAEQKLDNLGAEKGNGKMSPQIVSFCALSFFSLCQIETRVRLRHTLWIIGREGS